MRMFEEDVENKLINYLNHARDNELEIMASTECVCLHCGEYFSAREVHFWEEHDHALSGRCPKCGLPFLVGDASGLSLEKKDVEPIVVQMASKENSPVVCGAIKQFCLDFQAGKLDVTNLTYATQYESYLRFLDSTLHDTSATYALARLYVEGSVATKANPDTALRYFEDDALSYDGNSFYQAGLIYLTRNTDKDDKKAFECFAKASALGSLEGSMYVGLFYLHGNAVKADEDFGLNVLLSVIGNFYSRALTEHVGYPEFAFCSFHIGLCFDEGMGVRSSAARAAHYWLMTIAALGQIEESQLELLPWIPEFYERWQKIRDANKDAADTPLFDEDTFFESFSEQQDVTSLKFLNYMNYSEDEGTLRFGISSSAPMLVLDTGSSCFALLKDTEWEMTNVKFERFSLDNVFNRFEFVSQDVVRFVMDDPIAGPKTVVELRFEPLPEEESGDAE